MKTTYVCASAKKNENINEFFEEVTKLFLIKSPPIPHWFKKSIYMIYYLLILKIKNRLINLENS